MPIATSYLITIHIINLYLHSKTHNIDLKKNLDLTSLSCRDPGKPVNHNFPLYQSYKNNDKLNYCFKIQSITAKKTSICTLNLLKLSSTQIHIWCQFPVAAWQLRQSPFFQIPISKKELEIYLLFQKSQKNGCNNLYHHPYFLHERKKSFSYLT